MEYKGHLVTDYCFRYRIIKVEHWFWSSLKVTLPKMTLAQFLEMYWLISLMLILPWIIHYLSNWMMELDSWMSNMVIVLKRDTISMIMQLNGWERTAMSKVPVLLLVHLVISRIRADNVRMSSILLQLDLGGILMKSAKRSWNSRSRIFS